MSEAQPAQPAAPHAEPTLPLAPLSPYIAQHMPHVESTLQDAARADHDGGTPPAPGGGGEGVSSTHLPHIKSRKIGASAAQAERSVADRAVIAAKRATQRRERSIYKPTPESKREANRIRQARYKAKVKAEREAARKLAEQEARASRTEPVIEPSTPSAPSTPLSAGGLISHKSNPNPKNVMKLTFSLSPRQIQALNADEFCVLYGGAKGGGKSWWACVWMFLMAVKHKGNKLFFCRRRSVDFTNTTLETWKKAIPANLYRINEQKKKIYVPVAKSVIDYGGLDDPMLVQSLNSAEYAHICVDQAEEIEQDQFSMLRGTLRHKLADGTHPKFKIRLTANPAQCWLKNNFLLNPQEGFKFISALPTDNPYLPKDYVKNLEEAFKHRPALLAAYLHGSWDDLASHDICIQGAWIQKALTRHPSQANVTKRVVVNDPARYGDDENVIYVMEECGGIARKVHEQILEHKSLMDTAGRLVALRKKWEASLIAVDVCGIGAGIVDSLAEMKEPVLPINSSARPTLESNMGKYYNLRSQLWMEAGIKFADGLVQLEPDTILTGQLASTKFKFISSGRVQVESKDDVKKRLGRSPDRADAFIMGLHALDYSERLDRVEIERAETDRVGHGERVVAHDYVGVGEDYSGYGYAG